MIPEVHTQIGLLPNGRYSVAVLVLDLDSEAVAREIAAELQKMTDELVKDKTRHGLYVVANDAIPPQETT